MKDGRESPSLHLDLSNFEDGVDSRYVLTSPRSLEACARLGVRPVELLHKTLEEVREENPEAGNLRLNDLYVAQEIERRRKLEMCRELRTELLQRDWQPDRGGPRTPGVHKECPPLTSLDQRDSPSLSTDRYNPLDTSTRGYRDCSALTSQDQRDPPSFSTNHQDPLDTLTRGHKVCPPLTSLYQQDPPFSTNHRDPLDTLTRGQKDCPPLTSLYQQDPPFSTNHRDPLDRLTRGHKDCSPLSFHKQGNPSALSTDRRVPQSTSTKDHRVSSGTLRRSLSQGDLFQSEQKARRMARTVERELWASVPERDKKIGALMLLKHREEEMSQKRRLQAQQAWDNLKTEERYIRAALDRQDWPNQLQSHRRRSWSSQLDWQVDPMLVSSTEDQKALLKYGLTKAMADLKSKNTFYDSSSSHPLEERMLKAFKAKMIKNLQEKKNVQIKNEYEKLRHSRLKEKVDNQAKAEEHVRKVSIQQKEQRSKEIQEKLVEERNKGLYEKAFREDEQKLMAKLRVMRLEKEQKEHKKMLAQLTDHKIQKARDSLERSTMSKAERARELNFVKESVHQALKKRVDQEMENQRKETSCIIKMKDQKSQKIRKAKEATIEEGRRIARASFHFREKIREQTKNNTFDQMALQAQLNASLLKTIP